MMPMIARPDDEPRSGGTSVMSEEVEAGCFYTTTVFCWPGNQSLFSYWLRQAYTPCFAGPLSYSGDTLLFTPKDISPLHSPGPGRLYPSPILLQRHPSHSQMPIHLSSPGPFPPLAPFCFSPRLPLPLIGHLILKCIPPS